MIIGNALSTNEFQLLRSVRLCNKTPDYNALDVDSGKNLTQLQTVVGKLIWLVRECDPFVVNLNHLNDRTVSIFELQVLYAIASFRCGREKATIEVLNWWLPSVKIEKALCLVQTITFILDEIEIETPSPEKLSEYMLGATETRLRKKRFHVIEGGLSEKYPETLH